MENSKSYDLLYEMISHLDNFDIDNLKQLIDDENNVVKLRDIAWDLVPKVMSYVSKENSKNLDFIQCCEDILLRLCEIGNVKEILLALLEQVECNIDDVTFVTLLDPLRMCLQSLQSSFGHSLAVTLETLYGYLASLPLPEIYQLDDEERKLLESNDDVRRIVYLVNEALLFVATFVLDDTKYVWHNRDVTKFFINILDHPLGHLDLVTATTGNVQSSSTRFIADKLMGYMAFVEKDFSVTLQELLAHNERLNFERKKKFKEKQSKVHSDEGDNSNGEMDDLMVEEPIPELGLAVFAFLAITDPAHEKCIPQVLTSIHWLDLTKNLILLQFNHNNVLIKLKGVATLKKLLSRCDIITAEHLNWDACKLLLDGIVLCISTSQSKDLSRSALDTFTMLYSKCEPKRRFKVLYYLYSALNHSGMIDYITGLLKKDIDKNLRLNPEERDPNFVKPMLVRLFKLVFVLPEQEKTDLLEHSERILGAINLQRYLVVRDKPDMNDTGIWTVMKWVQSGFNQQLQVGIDMSRAHYQLDIDKLNKMKGKKQASSENQEMEVSVSGQIMAGLSTEQKLNVLQTAVYRFDMMESVLARARELIDQVKQ